VVLSVYCKPWMARHQLPGSVACPCKVVDPRPAALMATSAYCLKYFSSSNVTSLLQCGFVSNLFFVLRFFKAKSLSCRIWLVVASLSHSPVSMRSFVLHSGVIYTKSYVMMMHITAVSLRHTISAISHSNRSNLNVETSVSHLTWNF
jgi:hypothetical protein